MRQRVGGRGRGGDSEVLRSVAGRMRAAALTAALLVRITYSVKEEMKCSGNSEILHEIVRNTTRKSESITNLCSITNYFV